MKSKDYKKLRFDRYIEALREALKHLETKPFGCEQKDVWMAFNNLEIYNNRESIYDENQDCGLAAFLDDLVDATPPVASEVKRAIREGKKLLSSLSEVAPHPILKTLPQIHDAFIAKLSAKLPKADRPNGCRWMKPLLSKRTVFTKSQKKAFERLCEAVDLFYSAGDGDARLNLPNCDLNLNQLMVAPTGSGKTILVEAVGRECGCEVMRVTRQTLVPVGAIDGVPTLNRLASLLLQKDRVLLHIDELDKCLSNHDSSWERTNMDTIYSILEGRVDWSAIDLKPETVSPLNKMGAIDGKPPTLAALFRKKVFFVASGTWQSIHTSRDPAAIKLGFGGNSQVGDENEGAALMRRLRDEGGLPDEIARRFSLNVIRLEYPDVEDTHRMLEALGIYRLAKKAGRTIRPEDICYEGHGMSVLTSLATELTLECNRLTKSNRQRRIKVESDDLNVMAD